jgi:tRNA uridine 5-carboxymethylaminomethyl modification enzyme
MTLIRENKEKSPMFNGQITGIGPRYCPSIEDKAFRYLDRNEHHIFIEPEGLNLNTIYPNGISTSLPKDIQEGIVRSIPGLEDAKIEIYGYAVEYDVVDTSFLKQTLEYKEIEGLYFAGQVCGTSGYEEAAGQGIIAGINAARSFWGLEKFFLNRSESYIGVMVEDLVSNVRDEPYRLFTSRSENRLEIREDNTLTRMFPYRKQLNLNNSLDLFYQNYNSQYELLLKLVNEVKFYSSDASDTTWFAENGFGLIIDRIFLTELLRRANVDPYEVLKLFLAKIGLEFNDQVVLAVAVEAKYHVYVVKMQAESEKFKRLLAKKINWVQFSESKNVSFECRARINRIRPETFGQLKNMDGIRPATLAYVAGVIS